MFSVGLLGAVSAFPSLTLPISSSDLRNAQDRRMLDLAQVVAIRQPWAYAITWCLPRAADENDGRRPITLREPPQAMPSASRGPAEYTPPLSSRPVRTKVATPICFSTDKNKNVGLSRKCHANRGKWWQTA